MAAGCPVLMSDLGSHNELAIPGTPLPPFKIGDWAAALHEIHSEWVERSKRTRTSHEEGIEQARKFSSSVFSDNMSAAYESLFSS
jgi:glycosyltransferase involved in cell wall biosynthesis